MNDLASPADWQAIFRLLDLAFDLPPAERAAWLESQSGTPATMRSLLERLLAQDVRLETADFLESPISFDAIAAAAAWQTGVRVGPYRLERELGVGGMGQVWLARRVDGQLDRQVALKLPFAGPFQRELMLRFARERDILAALVHPNIARLYDAGITETGQAFLALEYVEGESLTAYCAARDLAIDARLELFTQVLKAVGYAHASLVIHRDLKPSNILVTAGGEVRLLDFGIAKLMVAGETHQTMLTEFAGRALTPDYASPEQIAGAPLNTSSDVYSLGVLLYELLTGERPYRLPRASRAALEEAILTADPIRPSDAVRTGRRGGNAGQTASRLRRSLAGDLDTIVLKALKKRPAERYATVDALLQDVERQRRGDPVLARPDGAWYRSRKFIGRHRYAVGGVLTAAGLLVVATLTSLHQARIAREQASVAQREAKRAEAVQQFLLDIFRTNTHLQPDPLRARQTTAREMLDIGAAGIGERLRDFPEAQADVLVTLADMYTQMGLMSQAARLRLERVDALKRARGELDLDVAEALLDYVEDISATGDRNRSMPAIREAQRIVDAIGDQDPVVRAEWWYEYGRLLRFTEPETMRAAGDRAVKIALTVPPRSWTYPLALELAAQARVELGAYDEALELNSKSLDAVHRKEPQTSAWEIQPLAQRAAVESAQWRVGEAERDFRAALEISRRFNGDSHGVTLQMEARLGAFLHSTSRRSEGAKLLDMAGSGLERIPDIRGSTTASLINTLRGRALFDDGRFDRAEPLIAMAVEDARAVYPGSSLLAGALLDQAELFRSTDRLDAAARALTEALEIRRRVGGFAKDSALVNPFLIARARLSLAQADAEGAIGWARQVCPPSDALRRPLLVEDLEAHLVLSGAYAAQNRVDDARREARAVVDAVQSSPLRAYVQPLEASALLHLGTAMRAGTDPTGACAVLRQALHLRIQTEDPASPRLAEVRKAQCR